ncbi:AraC family transcriptional regulator [Methylopila jiangsuensis]|uniref:AraC family transcriptional regulator n=2 Tax=Methylopila jiangsuensis TaxID=586230 RepID=A0A9W6N3U6_9HYPH|nr:AraC family transcriptional regulator [Methylopila jiangsuensis]GLK77424.1 AraC family transcriptional regulator [Methylopila jiangsuensis]
MQLVSGAETFSDGAHVTEPVRDGLRVIVVLDGAMTLSVGDQPELVVDRPTVFAVFSEGESARDQRFAPDLTFRYVLVWLDSDLIAQELGAPPTALFATVGRSSSGGALALAAQPADAGLQAVAGQIIACPEGPQHNLYRSAKAMELLALSIDALRPAERRPSISRLTAADITRVEAAREALIAVMQRPPDIDALAAQVGFTPRRLNDAFRARFGSTPYAYLQEHRLQTAYRALSSGARGAAECAYLVGYTPAHFATLFRKRFGMPPSALTRRAGALRTTGSLERA